MDLFINIASMQEMDMNVINNYFNYMRQSSKDNTYFYCCNRAEKILPDGSKIKFNDYPWYRAKIISDEKCQWYQKYPASKPPFWRNFDGPLHHRLVKF